MSTISKVTIQNFQSHTLSEYNFSKTGVNIIKGPNGNGKSVLIRALRYALNPHPLYFRDPTHRKGKIKRGSYNASINIEFYDSFSVFLNINEDASNTYYEFSDIPHTKFYISKDRKFIVEKLESINLHSMSIQLFKDKIPFIDDDGVKNLELIEKALSDKVAETIKENAIQTLANFTEAKNNKKIELNFVSSRKNSIQTYKIERIESRIELLEKLEEAMRESLPLIDKIEDIHIPKNLNKKQTYKLGDNLDNINISIKTLKSKVRYALCNTQGNIHIPNKLSAEPIYKLAEKTNEVNINIIPLEVQNKHNILEPIDVNVNNLQTTKRNLDKIRKGVCPTCRRSL